MPTRLTLLTASLALAAGVAHAFAPIMPPASEINGLHPLRPAAPLAQPILPLTTADISTTNALTPSRTYAISEVEIRGSTLISPSQLEPLVARISGQNVTADDLAATAQAITGLYRQRGYFLARATLPQQNLTNGRLLIEILEGKRGSISLNASASVQKSALVQSILARLNKSDFSQHAIESALMDLNAIPGITATGNLTPTPGNPRTTDLALTLSSHKADGELAFSNAGTRYLGPNQAEATLNLNNVLMPSSWNDQLHLRSIVTPALGELTYADATYRVPISTHGTTAEVGGLYGLSKPGWTLADLDISSKSTGWFAGLNQSLVNTRTTQWDVGLKLENTRAETESNNNPLTRDRLAPIRLTSVLTTADSHNGLNRFNLELTQGTKLFNATQEGTALASRTRGSAQFSKAKLEVMRLQRLNEAWNLLLAGTGQFSSNALLAGEEFGFGGSTYGRGYQSNEILGEQGVAAKAELQLTFHPMFPWLPAYQLFGFYDAGAVWNKDRDITESNQAQTRTSGGFGGRLTFSPTLSAELTLAKPFSHNTVITGKKDPVILFKLRKTFADNFHNTSNGVATP